MNTKFIRAVTEDKLILQGLLFEPDQPTEKIVLHIHGMAGNFYENKFLDFMAETFTQNGWAFLTVNTRGHDMIADFPVAGDKEEYKRIGNAFEDFTECILDIKTWMDFTEQQGFSNIVLQGHSLGSVKSVYYLAKTGDKRVQKLLLAAPPDMVTLTEEWPKHKEMLELSKKWVEQGRERDLIPENVDDWYYLSARTYLQFSTRGGEIDVFNYSDPLSPSALSEITVPTLAYIGSDDWCMVVKPADGLEMLTQKAKNCPKFDTQIIEGTGHSYWKKEQEAAGIVVNWLNKNG